MDPPSTATGGGAPDDDTTTATPSSLTLTSLRLEAASGPLSLHRDKVSALAWLPPPAAGEGGGGNEAGASSISLASTSDDGSFRLSDLVWEGEGAGEGTASLVLRSKRHFAPSDIALSSCGLLDGDGGSSDPLAVLSSWDNRVYGAFAELHGPLSLSMSMSLWARMFVSLWCFTYTHTFTP